MFNVAESRPAVVGVNFTVKVHFLPAGIVASHVFVSLKQLPCTPTILTSKPVTGTTLEFVRVTVFGSPVVPFLSALNANAFGFNVKVSGDAAATPVTVRLTV